jgi:rod shape-determining protein MreD
VSRSVRLGLVLLIAYLLQVSLVSQLRLFGVAPDVLLLVTILVAFEGGREVGALTGFAAGLLADLSLPTPLGLSALALAVVGNLVAVARENVTEPTRVVRVLGVLTASAVGVGLFAVVGELFDQETFELARVLRVALVVGLWNVVLVPVGRRPVRWALVGGAGARPTSLRTVV